MTRRESSLCSPKPPEIPVRLDAKERREAVSNMVKECAVSGESWVAIADTGCITGFLLVEPDKMERFHRDNQALHLRYAAVAKSQRKQGIFRALIHQVMNRKVPMTATVKPANQSGMATRLTQMGFKKLGSDSRLEGDNFRWQP
jgi:DnaJ-class molecular chaperone